MSFGKFFHLELFFFVTKSREDINLAFEKSSFLSKPSPHLYIINFFSETSALIGKQILWLVEEKRTKKYHVYINIILSK